MKKRIGIVGGGQLGRMLALAARSMGFQTIVLDPQENSPAGQVADSQIVKDFKDEMALNELAAQCDFLTIELEHTNARVLGKLSENGAVVNPSPRTLMTVQDKLEQKIFLSQARISTAEFVAINLPEHFFVAAERLGVPYVLKKRVGSYDGRGNFWVDRDGAGRLILPEPVPLVAVFAERRVDFAKELAVVAARGGDGTTAVYPVVETLQASNICQTVLAPANISEEHAKEATNLATRVLSNLQGAGVFAIEMFLTKDGDILVNEIAPRVHNSGHFSIEACHTSQFEQHVRAITGMPLGATGMKIPASVMINILGERNSPADFTGLEMASSIPGVTVYQYGKRDCRVGRKMGHITAVADDLNLALIKAQTARGYIKV